MKKFKLINLDFESSRKETMVKIEFHIFRHIQTVFIMNWKWKLQKEENS